MDVDGMYQDAGEKVIDHLDPLYLPRRRANQRCGCVTFANDRSPIVGMVGLESKEVRLEGLDTLRACELGDFVAENFLAVTTICTDEWCGNSRAAGRHGRGHRTVGRSGSKYGYAVDGDGDELREVHCNAMEAFRTELRTYLVPFRG